MDCAQSKPKTPAKNYHCVQALRAVAAGMVVLHHSITAWLDWVVRRPGAHQWGNGAAGVDIFFAISGFVMAISLPGLAGKSNKAGVFLWRRFTRIVPLYWGATTLKLVLLKLRIEPARRDAVRGFVARTGGRVLDPSSECFIVELLGSEAEINGFMRELATHAELFEVVRSGALGISRSQRVLRVVE